MKLSQLVANTGVELNGEDVEIKGVTDDSRNVKPGDLFLALPGKQVDGATFVPSAVEKGAVAALAEHGVDIPNKKVPVLVSKRVRRTAGLLASNFFGNPAAEMKMVGVTGTNGKTTTTYLLEAIAKAAGASPGVFGTVNYRFARETVPASHTTPGPVELQRVLKQMKDASTDFVIMEVSSHALDQERVAGLTFSAAAFTNLTRDHLDYHRDMDEYFDAKSKLFTQYLAPDGVAVVNGDDEWGQRLAAELKGMKKTAWRFSTKNPQAEILGSDAKVTLDGIELNVKTPLGPVKLKSALVGQHNIENMLAATGLAVASGMPRQAIGIGVSMVNRVPGRLERVVGKGVNVFIDYAHTDDALRRVMSTLRTLGKGRLVVMFGCGGDRDQGKRVLMGEAVGKAADQVIVTNDNPRTESPQAITQQIMQGLEKGGMKRAGLKEMASGARGYEVELDRKLAIEIAIGLAKEGDVVLLAGKGHESYQIIGTEKRHFDDVEEAKRVLGK
ncbi:MAG: UDP-N-acetylmuramoyl-L-alanyl-D-glutamate--2,6-diaminopimelate ligase [Deltaproteobacteria bacterium]|nr:UDP-N-acetylmuramoyl-L-alanyl-D-glutamate--2,6-diaminopimelate ligase [Deltaproteobacteria bacterium]